MEIDTPNHNHTHLGGKMFPMIFSEQQTGMTMVMLQAMVHPMVPKSNRITCDDFRFFYASLEELERQKYLQIVLNMKHKVTFTTKSITFREAL